MSKKKVYLRVRLLESWEDGQVKVHVKECDGFSVHLHVKRKDLLIVTPNSNIVPWSPAKAKKQADFESELDTVKRISRAFTPAKAKKKARKQ